MESITRDAADGTAVPMDATPPRESEAGSGAAARRIEIERLRERIRDVERRIRPHIRRTPAVEVAAEDFGLDGPPLILKLELLQHAGSFKARGAFANLLLRDLPPVGVVAASGGNHGAAVAWAARATGVHAKIFVPRISSPAKVQRIRDYGADLAIVGETYGDALAASQEWARDTGALPVHAFDQEETILGQGTVALELEAQVPDRDTVLAGVGGGGLISGIASWYLGRARVVGVEPEGAPTLTRALEAGRPVDAPVQSIAADSLAPTRVGERTFEIASRAVERVVLVSDDDIRAARRALWRTLRVVAEPGGSAAFAAVLAGRYRPAPDERIAVVVSGGNTVLTGLDEA
jgi:threonine dehydratase